MSRRAIWTLGLVRFPIEADAETFENRSETLLRGVSSEHRDAIAGFQPYNDVLWPYYVFSEPHTSIDAITSLGASRAPLPEGTEFRRLGSADYTFTLFYGDVHDEHEEIPLEHALSWADEGVAEVIATFEAGFES